MCFAFMHPHLPTQAQYSLVNMDLLVILSVIFLAICGLITTPYGIYKPWVNRGNLPGYCRPIFGQVWYFLVLCSACICSGISEHQHWSNEALGKAAEAAVECTAQAGIFLEVC